MGNVSRNESKIMIPSVADPDLQIREGGTGHPDSEIRGGGGLKFLG